MPRSSSPSILEVGFPYQRHEHNFQRGLWIQPPSPSIVCLNDDDDDEVMFVQEIPNTPRQQPQNDNSNGLNVGTSGSNKIPVSSSSKSSKRTGNKTPPLRQEDRVVTTTAAAAAIESDPVIVDSSVPQLAAEGRRRKEAGEGSVSSTSSPQPATFEASYTRRNGQSGNREEQSHENRSNRVTAVDMHQERQGISNNSETRTEESGRSRQASLSANVETPNNSVIRSRRSPLIDFHSSPEPNGDSRKRTLRDSTETNSSKRDRCDGSVMESNPGRSESESNTRTNPVPIESRGGRLAEENSQRSNRNDGNHETGRNRKPEGQQQNKDDRHDRSRRRSDRSCSPTRDRGGSSYGWHSSSRFKERDRGFDANHWNRKSSSSFNHRNNETDRGRWSNGYHRNDRSNSSRSRRMDDDQSAQHQQQRDCRQTERPVSNHSSTPNNSTPTPPRVSSSVTSSTQTQDAPVARTSRSSSCERERRRSESSFTKRSPVNEVRNSSHRFSPKLPKEICSLIKTCSQCQRTCSTRAEGLAHLKQAHDMKLCFICFRAISRRRCFLMQHFKYTHAAGDTEEKAMCPVRGCTAMHTFEGMYQHLCKMHLIDYEKNPTDKRRKGEHQNHPSRESEIRSSCLRGSNRQNNASLPNQSSNQARNARSFRSPQNDNFRRSSGGRSPNNRRAEGAAPRQASSNLSSVQNDQVGYNLAHASRTGIRPFRIPKKSGK